MLAASALAIAVTVPQLVPAMAFAQTLPPECEPDEATPDGTVACVASAPNEIEGISTNVDDLTVVIGDEDAPTIVREGDGPGVAMTGEGSQSLIVQNSGTRISASRSYGYANGVSVEVVGGVGDLTIVSDGEIEGTDNGIYAHNVDAGGISVVADSAIGERGSGIAARVNGPGDVTISSRYSAGTEGISVRAIGNASGDIDITSTQSAFATGSYGAGIEVVQYGSGSTTIRANEARPYNYCDVCASTNEGIRVTGGGTAGDIDVATTGLVRGGNGIRIFQNGTGTVTVDAATAIGFDVSGFEGVGVSVQSRAADIVINSTEYAGGIDQAIRARQGGGSLTINAVDTYAKGFSSYIENRGVGIQAESGIVSSFGANYNQVANGPVSITSTGTAFGGSDGIRLLGATQSDLTIVSNNATGEDRYGIYAYGSSESGYMTIASSGTAEGGQSGIRAIHRGDGDLSITSNDTFGNSGSGIYAERDGVGGISIASTGLAEGGENGISANNAGSGALSITAVDTAGGGNDGIRARNYAGSTDLTIVSTGLAEGQDDGISAVQQGSGALRITAQDSNGITGEGIVAVNEYGTDLVISSGGSAVGAGFGIYAFSYGSGAITIDAVDTTGSDDQNRRGAGISAFNTTGGTDISITSTGTATSAVFGIYAGNSGSGALTIDAADANGTGYVGIFANNSVYGTDLVINATGSVSGGLGGINATNNGSGELVINAAETFGGDIFDAISADLGSNGTDLTITTTGLTSGNFTGIDASHYGSGSLTIDAGGDVVGGFGGISADIEGDGTDLTIVSRATVSGGNGFGISAENAGSGSLSITANEVFSDTADAINVVISGNANGISVVTTGLVLGGESGIDAVNQGVGALTITATNTIGGTFDIAADQPGPYGPRNDTSNGYGIKAFNGRTATDLSITSTGVAAGGINGIEAVSSGSGEITINSAYAYGGAADPDATVFDYGYGFSNFTFNGNGIEVVAFEQVTSVSVTSTGLAAGGANGIKATSGGSGSLTITANDTYGGEADPGASVYSNHSPYFNPTTNGDGIRAANSAKATDLTITSTGTAAGGANGIYAENYGTGALTINANNAFGGTYETDPDTSTSYNPTVNGSGILAYNAQTATDMTITATGEVAGGMAGIFADQNGTGALLIEAVDSYSANGSAIEAVNSANGTDLTISSTGLAEGGENGISAKNYGSGALSIMANNTIGNGDDGIRARAYGNGDGLSIVSTGLAKGEDDGISAENQDIAAIGIIAADSTGVTDAGIVAYGFISSTGITINSSGTATGGIDGIRSINGGSGDLVIVANDSLGASYSGIIGVNLANGEDLSITSTGTANGQLLGIAGFQEGTGSLTVTANNTVGGVNGISARNEGAGTDVTVISTGTATGGVTDAASTLTLDELLNFGAPGSRQIVFVGIGAFNAGSGATTVEANDSFGGDLAIAALHAGTDVSVTSTGLAEGGFLGIGVLNDGSGNLSVDANDTNGIGYGGILAFNATAGDVSVISRGSATGAAFGIGVSNYGPGQVAISANDASGGVFGITASSLAGPISLTTTGTVQGGQDGISLTSFAGSAEIDNGGRTSGGRYGVAIDGAAQGTMTIRNRGTLAGGQAAIGVGAPPMESASAVSVALTNEGTLVGRIQFRSGDDRIDNSGTFTATQDSDFGAGTDVFDNSGTLFARSSTPRSFLGLERFLNSGAVDLANGEPGTNFVISGDFEGTNGSLLVLDLQLDGNGAAASDLFTVEGAATGSTTIRFNAISAAPRVLTSDIVLVDAGAGTSSEAFVLDTAFRNEGLIQLGVTYNAADNNFRLSSAPGVAVYRTASFAEAARNLWLRSNDAWSREMAGLRDRTEPSEGQLGGSSESEAGFWISSFGSKIERGRTVNPQFNGITSQFEVGYDQDFFGIQAGIDLGSANFGYGLTGGYLSSELGFAGSADSVDYDVLNIGAYIRFDTGPFFGSALAKYDTVSATSTSVSGGYSADVDGDAYGATAEVGALFGNRASFYVEPVASLSWFKATIDNFETAQGSFAFDEGEGLLGKIGTRVGSGFEIGATTATIYVGGQYVHQFEGEDLAAFASGGQTVSFANPAIDDYANFALGLGLGEASDPVRGTFEANYMTGDDVDGYGVAIRVRFRF